MRGLPQLLAVLLVCAHAQAAAASICDSLNAGSPPGSIQFVCEHSEVEDLNTRQITVNGYLDSENNEVYTDFSRPVPLEEYLQGVIKAEMTDFDEEDACKAQILASLMFLNRHLDRNTNSISGLTDKQAFVVVTKLCPV